MAVQNTAPQGVSAEDWVHRCSWINQQKGRHKELYLNLLKEIAERPDAETCRLIIVGLMPPEIQNRELIRLAMRCLQINQGRGSREKRYFSLLSVIEARSRTVFDLSEKCSLIFNLMPEEVWGREGPQKAISLVGWVEDLDQSYEYGTLESINQQVCLVEYGSPSHPFMDALIRKCKSIYNRKCGISLFSKKRRLKLDPPLPQDGTRGAQANSVYPILSIDGGGIRGIIPATVLVEIENITEKPVSALFKSIGGTSTGGILALGLSAPNADGTAPRYSAQQLLGFYLNDHDRNRIFQPNTQREPDSNKPKEFGEKVKWVLNNPKYLSPMPFFNDKLGNTPLSSALTDVVITANTPHQVLSKGLSVGTGVLTGTVDLLTRLFGYEPILNFSHDDIPKEICIFTKNGLKTLSYSWSKMKQQYSRPPSRSSYDLSNSFQRPFYNVRNISTFPFTMSCAAQATSAAPSYFPTFIQPISNTTSKTFLDGGLLQNDPTLPCIVEALNKRHSRESLFVVSLGTGKPTGHVDYSDFSDLALDLWFEITQPDYSEARILQDRPIPTWGAYHRFEHFFPAAPPKLDDCSPEAINALQDAGNALVEDKAEELRDVCKLLSPDTV